MRLDGQVLHQLAIYNVQVLKQYQGHTDSTHQLTLTLRTRVIYTLPHYIYTQHAHTDIIYCNTSAYTDTHQFTHSDNTQTHTDSTPMCAHCHTLAHTKHTIVTAVQLQKVRFTRLISLSCRVAEQVTVSLVLCFWRLSCKLRRAEAWLSCATRHKREQTKPGHPRSA